MLHAGRLLIIFCSPTNVAAIPQPFTTHGLQEGEDRTGPEQERLRTRTLRTLRHCIQSHRFNHMQRWSRNWSFSSEHHAFHISSFLVFFSTLRCRSWRSIHPNRPTPVTVTQSRCCQGMQAMDTVYTVWKRPHRAMRPNDSVTLSSPHPTHSQWDMEASRRSSCCQKQSPVQRKINDT